MSNWIFVKPSTAISPVLRIGDDCFQKHREAEDQPTVSIAEPLGSCADCIDSSSGSESSAYSLSSEDSTSSSGSDASESSTSQSSDSSHNSSSSESSSSAQSESSSEEVHNCQRCADCCYSDRAELHLNFDLASADWLMDKAPWIGDPPHTDIPWNCCYPGYCTSDCNDPTQHMYPEEIQYLTGAVEMLLRPAFNHLGEMIGWQGEKLVLSIPAGENRTCDLFIVASTSCVPSLVNIYLGQRCYTNGIPESNPDEAPVPIYAYSVVTLSRMDQGNCCSGEYRVAGIHQNMVSFPAYTHNVVGDYSIANNLCCFDSASDNCAQHFSSDCRGDCSS